MTNVYERAYAIPESPAGESSVLCDNNLASDSRALANGSFSRSKTVMRGAQINRNDEEKLIEDLERGMLAG